MQFANRVEAGRLLAKKLQTYADRRDVIVLALPRGGVPVAYEVAHALDAPLDVFLVRKLGVPGHEELAMGAIASGGVRELNEQVLFYLSIPNDEIERVTRQEQTELVRREKLYRGDAKPLEVRGHTVILVDDGLATGSTMRAAISALKRQQPAEIVVAVPVAPRETCDSFKAQGDSMCVCAVTPKPFDGVGRWYKHFAQTSDAEVRYLLKHAKQPTRRRAA